jgi:putative endonuclease
MNSINFMFYYTYVLRSKKDGLFYTGCTKDLKSRFEQHKNGEVESTRDRRPLELLYYEACKSNIDALHREKYLKRNYGKMFLRNRLKSYLKE